MFRIVEQYGDIFVKCPSHIPLAHCVSLDFHMGKGIAKLFKQKFGNVHFLKSQIQKVGQCVSLNYEGRFILYMASKRCFFLKPTYESLAQSLQSLKAHMKCLGLRHLAMPRVATGLDNLQWIRVKAIITDIFSGSDITIYVFYI